MKKCFFSFLIVLFLCSCSIHGHVKNYNFRAVKQYVQEGRDINKRSDPYRHTLLYVASYHGHELIVQYLCDQGADVNAQAKDGSTALICAAQYSYPAIAKILVEAGADITLKDNGGDTALDWAKYNRAHKVAEYLTLVQEDIAKNPEKYESSAKSQAIKAAQKREEATREKKVGNRDKKRIGNRPVGPDAEWLIYRNN